MQHTIRIAASRFNAPDMPPGRDLAVWLRQGLVDDAQEAEIGEPGAESGNWVVWLDLGGDRYRISVALDRDASTTDPVWNLSVDHHEPVFVRQHEARARQQLRFDALVFRIRQAIVHAPDIQILSESGD